MEKIGPAARAIQKINSSNNSVKFIVVEIQNPAIGLLFKSLIFSSKKLRLYPRSYDCSLPSAILSWSQQPKFPHVIFVHTDTLLPCETLQGVWFIKDLLNSRLHTLSSICGGICWLGLTTGQSYREQTHKIVPSITNISFSIFFSFNISYHYYKTKKMLWKSSTTSYI